MTFHEVTHRGAPGGRSGLLRKFKLRILPWLAFAVTATTGNDAAAYCIARPCNPEGTGSRTCVRDAKTGCALEGPELFRPDGCVYFAVQEGAAASVLGVSDQEFAEVIAEAFEVWASVDCGDGTPSIRVQSLGVVPSEQPFACASVPDLNIDVWLTSANLAGQNVVTRASPATAGVTVPSFETDSGAVFDADVTLNQLWFLLQEEQLAERLRIVAIHEAGHALGLAHSLDRGALMHRDYNIESGRTLTQDDIDGICKLYPPRAVECPSRSVTDAAFSRFGCDTEFARRKAEDPSYGEEEPMEQKEEEREEELPSVVEGRWTCSAGSGARGDAGLVIAMLGLCLIGWLGRRGDPAV